MNDWNIILGMFGGMISIFGLFSALMLWMMSRMENRLHTDITSVANRLDAHMVDSNNKWVAISARIDSTNAAMNARLDANQAIIMRMLEKRGM